ncbi:hypothetical protein J3F84DRAFT_350500 [Trichoderma pleuroticola]
MDIDAIALDKFLVRVSACLALALSALTGWMIYLVNGFHHANRVTGPVDCIFIMAVSLCKAITQVLLYISRYRRGLLKQPLDETADKDKLEHLYAASVIVFLNTLLIVRLFAWIEHFRARGESMKANSCFVSIAITAFELLFTLYDIRSKREMAESNRKRERERQRKMPRAASR